MFAPEGCASIADPAGNLLFYTNGNTVFDKTHSIMSNGSGLLGDVYATQPALIAKQPGNASIYYIFLINGSSGINYSIVDMSLSSGNGSVTVKNATLSVAPFTWQTEKLTGTRHCNGQDIWVVYHDQTTYFESYLLTSTGVTTSPVLSSAGTSHSSTTQGYMKISPTGKKIAVTLYNTAQFEVFDFDNSTGVVSNPLLLSSTIPIPYGCEFSPDGSKLYAGENYSSNPKIHQWDLCAGSSTAIVASQYTVAASGPIGSMQLASNGKIYASNLGSSSLDVINSPNISGSGCNFVQGAQSVAPKSCGLGLPNFISSSLKPAPTPFTYTANNSAGCQAANFTAPSFTSFACASVGYSLTGYLWNFGDPLSAGSNTSGLANPGHTFSGQGTYTTQLIMYYSCGGGTDTLRQVITIPPCVSVSSTSITCANLGSATVTPVPGLGPYTYTWLPGMQTGSVATGLIPGTYSVVFHDALSNVTSTSAISLLPLVPLSASVVHTTSLSCYGFSNGTGSVTGISGGSGNQSYLWNNGSSVFTSSVVNSLNAASWSVTITDALTACQVYSVFSISQPPAFTLAVSASTPSVCLGGSITLTGANSGGIGPYSYSWTAGPMSNTNTVSEATAGAYVYTLSSSDANNCLTSNTISVNFIPNPVLSVSDVSICPLQVATLSVSGASTYTWTSTSLSLTGVTFTDSPLASSQYTLVGSALGCSSQTVTNIILKALPVPVLNTNSPRCNGDNLNLIALGGSSYVWSGPNSFNSTLQNPNINLVSVVNAGVYNLTVTAANSCTASVSNTVLVNPTPTLSTSGATVCTSQTLNLSASSFTGSTYLWTGPLNYTSSLQNPAIANPSVTSSGNYTVKVTSAQNCTNTAIASAVVVPPPSLTLALSSNTLCEYAFNGSPNTITLTSSGAATYTLETPNHILNPNPSGPTSPLSTVPPYNGSSATATLTGSNGICSAVMTVSFSIIPNPTITVSSPTPVICAGQTHTYTNQGATSYTWGAGTPGITTYSTGQVAVANPSITSVFSVYGGSLGCNSAIQTTTITVNPLPTVGIVPGTATICLNSSIHLNATGNATTYTWSPFVGLSGTSGSVVSASPSSQQSYTLVGSLNSCTSSAMITVSVLPLPSPSLMVSKPQVCLNEEITLQGFGGTSYDWYLSLGIHFEGSPLSFTANNTFYSGIYTLTATDINGCKASTTTVIAVYSLPDGDLRGTKLSGCVPFSSEFVFYSYGTTKAQWQLNSEIFKENKFSYHFIKPGEYSIIGNLRDTVTTCINTKTILVNAYEVPVADFKFSPEKPVEGLDEVLFINTSKGTEQIKWNWYFVNNRGYRSQNEHTSYLFENAGLYPIAFTVLNKWGCSDTVVKSIYIENDFNLFVPNAFTPNQDGLNDVFLPIARGVRLYELSIFDRWGARIFTTTDQQSGWDGSYKGEACKNDVYTWRITLTTTAAEAKSYNGSVLLSR